MAKPKRKPDGRTSRALQRDSQETHQVPDNPPLSPMRDGIGDRISPLPDLRRSSRIQAAVSDMLGNGASSDQVQAKFQIVSEDCKGDPQTNREEDYESIRKSSDQTPLEGSGNRRVNSTPEEQNVLDVNAPQNSEAEIMNELFERRTL
jgi:hypothetical protein